jgi:hypothetical protein
VPETAEAKWQFIFDGYPALLPCVTLNEESMPSFCQQSSHQSLLRLLEGRLCSTLATADLYTAVLVGVTAWTGVMAPNWLMAAEPITRNR